MSNLRQPLGDEAIRRFLNGVPLPDGVDATRYASLAEAGVRQMVSELEMTPIFVTVEERGALLCLRGGDAAVIEAIDGNFVLHRTTADLRGLQWREVRPVPGNGEHRLEIEIPGLPGALVATGLSLDDLEPQRALIIETVA
jgi:hypothetical protein